MKGLLRTIWGLLAGPLGLVVAVLAFSACGTYESPTTQENLAASQEPGSSIGGLGPGDVISVTYTGAPELNLRQRIRGDGKVSLPMVGDVKAGGKALAKFQSELVRLYRPHLQDPSVVVARESTAAAVYVSGGVNNPTKIPLDRFRPDPFIVKTLDRSSSGEFRAKEEVRGRNLGVDF